MRRKSFPQVLLGLAATLVCFAAVAHAGEPPWIEVQSAHFRVVSNAGDKSAREVAWEFEQIRAVIQRLWPWARLQTDKPIVVLAAKDENAMKALVPKYWEQKGGIRPASVSDSGPDRHYIALRSDLRGSDQQGANPNRFAFAAYSGFVLAGSFDRPLPVWFLLGIQGLFSNTFVQREDVLLGKLIPTDVNQLRQGPRVPLRTLLDVDRTSSYYTRETDRLVFDREATALANYMLFGEGGANAPKLDHFVGMLQEGKDPELALRETFGDVDALERSFLSYVKSPLFGYRKIGLEVSVREEGFAVRTLSPAEAAATRAGLHAAMRRPVEARALLQEATQADPALALAHEVEGLLWDQENKPDEARKEYSRAVELGSGSFYAHYRNAQLLSRPRADHETLVRMDASLERARALNPDFAAAWSFGAEIKVSLGEAELGLALARRAVALEPRRSYHRVALARVLWRLSKREEAQREADQGLALAQTPQEKTRAQEFLDFMRKPSPSP
ncbi:MAG: tetratricopeptide repeat protein [Vicinamibacteria bacterium]